MADARYDVLIIGSGAAGLTLGLRCAAHARVAILSKGDLNLGATYYAQGGIAAVLDESDSIESHVADTMAAGQGLCHRGVVEHIVSRGAEAVRWLLSQGVAFTTVAGSAPAADLASLHLSQEGGHSHRRIIHARDATGKAVFETLRQRALAHPAIDMLTGYTAIDLVCQGDGGHGTRRCVGAYVFEQASGRVRALRASSVALATGGASKAYLYTSNPDGACGDGIAMAWRAGCRVANMEFNQFHPTCLYHPEARNFLITEALRGEGATLELPDGSRFMADYHDRAELAPRDVVARAIDDRMKRSGCGCVYLNISHRPAAFVREHFPTIYERCLTLGLDITRSRIPVVPAAHYTCGGVVVDRAGRTDIRNLYAIGETSCTGLHGANRIASNSLLECFVLAFGAADDIVGQLGDPPPATAIAPWDESRASHSEDEILIAHNWDELRRCMWDFVGIVRNNARLGRARRRIDIVAEEVEDYYARHRVTDDLLELRNLTAVASLIVTCAMARQESRGLHYNLDYPRPAERACDTVLTPPDGVTMANIGAANIGAANIGAANIGAANIAGGADFSTRVPP